MRTKPIDIFDAKLTFGLGYEALFRGIVGASEPQHAIRRNFDCIIPESIWGPGGTAEIKAEKTDSPNLCLKRLFNVADSGSISGPWKAAALGIDWFIEIRIPADEILYFKPQELVDYVEANKRSLRVINVPTKGRYETFKNECVLVPVQKVRHLVRNQMSLKLALDPTQSL